MVLDQIIQTVNIKESEQLIKEYIYNHFSIVNNVLYYLGYFDSASSQIMYWELYRVIGSIKNNK